MDPRDRDMLKRALELSEENNEMLKSMRTRMRIGTFLKIFYWVLIIGGAFGAYYFIQPYIDSLSETYSGLGDTIIKVQGLIK